MTSANFSDLFTPPPPRHCHKSAAFVPFVCFMGTPSPMAPLTADVIYGRHLTKKEKVGSLII